MTTTPIDASRQAARRKRRRRAALQQLAVALFGIVLLGAWELACSALRISELVLPAPSAIFGALVDGFRTGQFVGALQATLTEIVLGFVLAAVTAFALGTLISQVKLVEALLYPYVVAIQTLPKVAIAPLILVWVGFGIESKVIIAAMVAFFPILVNTIVGLKSTSADKIELMRSLRASRMKLFAYVQLPEALPYIFAGLNIGIVMSVLGAIVGEFIGSKAGLGYLLLQMNYNLDVAGMFAVLVVLGVLGIVLNFIARVVRDRVIFWQRDTSVTM
jgi:NitT/TauT family transport system permease protein